VDNQKLHETWRVSLYGELPEQIFISELLPETGKMTEEKKHLAQRDQYDNKTSTFLQPSPFIVKHGH